MKPNAWKSADWRTAIAVMCILGWAGLSGVSLFAPTMSRAADDLAKSAATVEEVTKVIDLETLPIPEAATKVDVRQLGMVGYTIKADVASALEFHRKQLLMLGWEELPRGESEPTYAEASFRKTNFVVMVMCDSSDTPNKKSSEVFLFNLGNVPLSKLPVVNGAKSKTSSDSTVEYTTDLKPAEAVEATRRLLMDSGWEPYGSESKSPDSVVMYFKSNAIRVKAVVDVDPDQEGKVLISYDQSVLAADLPAPPNAKEIYFYEPEKTLLFQSPDSFDEVAKFYQQRLAKLGWTLKTKELIQSKSGNNRPVGEASFQNAAKESLSLSVLPSEGQAKVRLRQYSAAQTASLQRAQEEEAKKMLTEKKAREAKVLAIAKLQKLTSAGKIVVDKETISLPHVFAYETVFLGQRVTRIFATEKPIKQTTLIEQLKQPDEVNEFALQKAPYLRLELDAQDQPRMWNLEAKETSSSDGGSGLKGEAIVVDGRARGTFKMLKPDDVGGHTISGEITFDVPVVTRDSQPVKLLANAKKLESSGKLLLNNKTIKLGSVVAYEYLSIGTKATVISFTDKPLDLPKLKAQLAKNGTEPGLSGFDYRVKLEVDDADNVSGLSVDYGNTSLTIIGDSYLLADVIIEDGRARGTIKLRKPGQDGDTKY